MHQPSDGYPGHLSSSNPCVQAQLEAQSILVEALDAELAELRKQVGTLPY